MEQFKSEIFVKDGPSREALTDSLRLNTKVKFSTNCGVTLPPGLGREFDYVIGLKRLDSIGETWKVELSSPDSVSPFELFYSTAKRSGFIIGSKAMLNVQEVKSLQGITRDSFHSVHQPLTRPEIATLLNLASIGSDEVRKKVHYRLHHGIIGLTFPMCTDEVVQRVETLKAVYQKISKDFIEQHSINEIFEILNGPVVATI
jgi:hypothetical protein